ncbi:hypothetical protein LNTAR_21205 [Lentisphaera araneosa HTCC2155]|uniref:Uncharacterized protein n=1 Tax=Lentisphaera araneosa HTCC2155 TaxID=313628 RepID=A6DLW1_9BACT|nr:hypothetical protein [Lentisphaera araneosa]EDM27259.1 hypothetical protein LNTAR_21135 [Lentisphaera araneosa HTCC2155]EDM27273.1 hypothetical protein LNTAR_21205 [Lentisphaera araneosa HTCC2155]
MSPLIMDMVHHNPGEALFETPFNEADYIAEIGYNAKAYFLFESPSLAIDWRSVDVDVFPEGSESEKWLKQKRESILAQHAKCRAAGLAIYAQADMVLLPKSLIQAYGIEKEFGDPKNPLVVDLIKKQIAESFEQFPDLDGFLFRIGETYLHDAPHHQGAIKDKDNTQETIIPLINLLREEICVKHKKKLIFRSWLSFDRDPEQYALINQEVEPHEYLTLAVKHSEDDFHRGTAFSRIIGQGRHPQIIEVQCSREYEGKAAHPNYIAAGVINGFEENLNQGLEIYSLKTFVDQTPELYAGVWTWCRGGGWNGPFAANKLWYELNAWVIATWAQNTSQSEEQVFERYCKEKLNLDEASSQHFRKLCLLSLDGVIRMRNTLEGDVDLWWARDMGFAWPKYIHDDQATIEKCLALKDEAVAIWQEMCSLADQISWPDEELADFAKGSVHYGLGVAMIYRSLFYADAAVRNDDKEAIIQGIGDYDQAWDFYESLPSKFKNLSTQYQKDYCLHLDPAENVIQELKKKYNV